MISQFVHTYNKHTPCHSPSSASNKNGGEVTSKHNTNTRSQRREKWRQSKRRSNSCMCVQCAFIIIIIIKCTMDTKKGNKSEPRMSARIGISINFASAHAREMDDMGNKVLRWSANGNGCHQSPPLDVGSLLFVFSSRALLYSTSIYAK